MSWERRYLIAVAIPLALKDIGLQFDDAISHCFSAFSISFMFAPFTTEILELILADVISV